MAAPEPEPEPSSPTPVVPAARPGPRIRVRESPPPEVSTPSLSALDQIRQSTVRAQAINPEAAFQKESEELISRLSQVTLGPGKIQVAPIPAVNVPPLLPMGIQPPVLTAEAVRQVTTPQFSTTLKPIPLAAPPEQPVSPEVVSTPISSQQVDCVADIDLGRVNTARSTKANSYYNNEELKAFLRRCGLNTTGKREDYVQRLRDFVERARGSQMQ